jgi:hypothetical protein
MNLIAIYSTSLECLIWLSFAVFNSLDYFEMELRCEGEGPLLGTIHLLKSGTLLGETQFQFYGLSSSDVTSALPLSSSFILMSSILMRFDPNLWSEAKPLSIGE